MLAPYKDPKSAYSKAMNAGKLGVGFGEPGYSKPTKSPKKKVPMKKFNAGGTYTKMHKKVFGL